MLPCFQNTFDFFEGDLSTWSIEYCYHQSYRILRTNCWLYFQIANFKKFPATKQQRPTSPWWQCQPLYLVAGLFLLKKHLPFQGREVPYEMRPVGPAFGCSTQVGCILTTPNQFIRSLLSNIFLKIQEIFGKYKHHSQGMIRRLGKGYNSTHSFVFLQISKFRWILIKRTSGKSIAWSFKHLSNQHWLLLRFWKQQQEMDRSFTKNWWLFKVAKCSSPRFLPVFLGNFQMTDLFGVNHLDGDKIFWTYGIPFGPPWRITRGFMSCGRYIPGKPVYVPPAGTFESMIFLFPRWDMLVASRVYLFLGGGTSFDSKVDPWFVTHHIADIDHRCLWPCNDCALWSLPWSRPMLS